MKVWAQPKRRVTPVNRGDGAALDLRSACERCAVPYKDLVHEDAQHGGEQPALAAQEVPEIEGQGQNPVSDGHDGEDTIDGVRGLSGHALRAARRASLLPLQEKATKRALRQSRHSPRMNPAESCPHAR